MVKVKAREDVELPDTGGKLNCIICLEFDFKGDFQLGHRNVT